MCHRRKGSAAEHNHRYLKRSVTTTAKPVIDRWAFSKSGTQKFWEKKILKRFFFQEIISLMQLMKADKT